MTSPTATTAPRHPAPPRAVRELPHPAPEDIRLVDVLHALADPVRLQVVRELAESADEQPCSVFELPVSKSTTTHHFRVLRECGVLRQTYRGTAKLNALRREDLQELFPGLLDCLLAAADRQHARGTTDPEGAPARQG